MPVKIINLKGIKMENIKDNKTALRLALTYAIKTPSPKQSLAFVEMAKMIAANMTAADVRAVQQSIEVSTNEQ